MKINVGLTTCFLILLALAACTTPRRTPSVIRPVATEVLTAATPDSHLVEVTRIVGTGAPTATPALCTPLPEGMYLTIHMPSAEGVLTIFFAAEDRFVSLALHPYRSEVPFEAQDQYVQLFEQVLASVQLLGNE